MDNRQRFNCFQQIATPVGGMTLTVVRHHPVNCAFHCRGIYRAIISEAKRRLLTEQLDRSKEIGWYSP
jgi:hypothetical protein